MSSAAPVLVIHTALDRIATYKTSMLLNLEDLTAKYWTIGILNREEVRIGTRLNLVNYYSRDRMWCKIGIVNSYKDKIISRWGLSSQSNRSH